jgi:hypothetical protein
MRACEGNLWGGQSAKRVPTRIGLAAQLRGQNCVQPHVITIAPAILPILHVRLLLVDLRDSFHNSRESQP